MADYKLSGAADQDSDRLYEYSLLEFGERVSDVFAEVKAISVRAGERL